MPSNSDAEPECQDRRQHSQLAKLVEEHKGNLSAIARAMQLSGQQITREGVAVRLRTHGLFKDAATARAASMVTGPRMALPEAPERKRLLQAIERGGTYEKAIELLGMSRRTFYRKLKLYQVEQRASKMTAAARRRRLTSEQIEQVVELVRRIPGVTATEAAGYLNLARWDAVARCREAEKRGLVERVEKARFRATVAAVTAHK